MRTANNQQNRKAEKLGRFIFNMSYWIYAIKFVAVASLLFLILLYFIHKPLWLAPIIGYAVFILWQSFRRFVLKKWSYFLRK